MSSHGTYGRQFRLFAYYGLQLYQYLAILYAQDGKCCLCGVAERAIAQHPGAQVLFVPGPGNDKLYCPHCSQRVWKQRPRRNMEGIPI